MSEEALIPIPPFKMTGRIHLMPERGLRDALASCRQFMPVTDAMYWSDSLGEARLTAELVAVEPRRGQILAPHHEVDRGRVLMGATAPRRARDATRGEPTGW